MERQGGKLLEGSSAQVIKVVKKDTEISVTGKKDGFVLKPQQSRVCAWNLVGCTRYYLTTGLRTCPVSVDI